MAHPSKRKDGLWECQPNGNWEYLIGAIQGDGNLAFNRWKNKRHPSGFVITVGRKNPEYVDLLAGFISATFGKSPIIRDKERVYRVAFYNAEIARAIYLYKHDGVWRVPACNQEHYLAGLWDTDGYIHTGDVGINQKARGNLYKISPLLEKLGFYYAQVRLYSYTNSLGQFNDERINMRNKRDIELFAKTIPLRNPEKIRQLKQEIIRLKSIKSRRRNYELLRDFIEYLRNNEPASAAQIAKATGKRSAIHITKELHKYWERGYFDRFKKNGRFYYVRRETA